MQISTPNAQYQWHQKSHATTGCLYGWDVWQGDWICHFKHVGLQPGHPLSPKACYYGCGVRELRKYTTVPKYFLQMLRQEAKDPKYMWNPCGFICNKNGANKLAIRADLGETMSEKTVSCQ